MLPAWWTSTARDLVFLADAAARFFALMSAPLVVYQLYRFISELEAVLKPRRKP